MLQRSNALKMRGQTVFELILIGSCLEFFATQKIGMTLFGLFYYTIFDLNPQLDSFYLQKKKTVYDVMQKGNFNHLSALSLIVFYKGIKNEKIFSFEHNGSFNSKHCKC